MNRAERRRWRGRRGLMGRDELFLVRVNPEAFDDQQAAIRGQRMSHPREHGGSKAFRGNTKGAGAEGAG